MTNYSFKEIIFILLILEFLFRPYALSSVVIFEPHFSGDPTEPLSYKTTAVSEVSLFPNEVENEINQSEFLESSIDYQPFSFDVIKPFFDFVEEIYSYEIKKDFRPNFTIESVKSLFQSDEEFDIQNSTIAVQFGILGEIEGVLRYVSSKGIKNYNQRLPVADELDAEGIGVIPEGFEFGRLATDLTRNLRKNKASRQNRISVMNRLVRALLLHLSNRNVERDSMEQNSDLLSGPIWATSDPQASKVYQSKGFVPKLTLAGKNKHVFKDSLADYIKNFAIPFRVFGSSRNDWSAQNLLKIKSQTIDLPNFKELMEKTRKECDEVVFHLLSDYYFLTNDFEKSTKYAREAYRCWPSSWFYFSNYIQKSIRENFSRIELSRFENWLDEELDAFTGDLSRVGEILKFKVIPKKFEFKSVFLILKKEFFAWQENQKHSMQYWIDLPVLKTEEARESWRKELEEADSNNCESFRKSIGNIPMEYRASFKELMLLYSHVPNFSCLYELYYL